MSNPTDPDHYHTPIQPLDYIEANGLNFHEGNVVKYVTRWRKKGGVEDLKKARVYLDRLIKLEESAMAKPKPKVKITHYAQTDEWMMGVGKLHGCCVLAVVAAVALGAIGGCIVWIA